MTQDKARDLLVEAQKETAVTSRADRVRWKALLPAIQVLKDEKGYTWKEVAQWLVDRGVQATPATVATAYARAKKTGGP